MDVCYHKNAQKRSIEDATVTSESLAAKPVQHVVLDSQRYLSIGFDLAKKNLTLKYFGCDPEKLPLVRKNLVICYHKMVDTTTSD